MCNFNFNFYFQKEMLAIVIKILNCTLFFFVVILNDQDNWKIVIFNCLNDKTDSQF